MGSRPRGSCIRKVQIIKKKKKNPTWIWLRNPALVQRRPLLICSSAVNCLCTSGWVSNITHWFVANREDSGWAKEGPYLCYFPFSPGLPGAQIFGHFPHRKHPPSPGAAQPQSRAEAAAAARSTEASGSSIGSTSTTRCCRSELSFWQDSNGNRFPAWEECQALIQPYFNALAPLEPDSKQGCAGMWWMRKQHEAPLEHTGPEAVSRTGIRCHQRESCVVLLMLWPLIGFKEWD